MPDWEMLWTRCRRGTSRRLASCSSAPKVDTAAPHMCVWTCPGRVPHVSCRRLPRPPPRLRGAVQGGAGLGLGMHNVPQRAAFSEASRSLPRRTSASTCTLTRATSRSTYRASAATAPARSVDRSLRAALPVGLPRPRLHRRGAHAVRLARGRAALGRLQMHALLLFTWPPLFSLRRAALERGRRRARAHAAARARAHARPRDPAPRQAAARRGRHRDGREVPHSLSCGRSRAREPRLLTAAP